MYEATLNFEHFCFLREAASSNNQLELTAYRPR